MKKGLFGLIIVLILISGCGQEVEEQTEKGVETEKPSNEITFSKSLNDPTEDCISQQTSNPINCNKAIDIISANLKQENNKLTAEITLSGSLPKSSELKEGEILSESYEYSITMNFESKPKESWYGAIAKEGISGGCVYYTFDEICNKDINVQIIGNKIILKGDLSNKIQSWEVKAIYGSSSLDEDDIEDVLEI